MFERVEEGRESQHAEGEVAVLRAGAAVPSPWSQSDDLGVGVLSRSIVSGQKCQNQRKRHQR